MATRLAPTGPSVRPGLARLPRWFPALDQLMLVCGLAALLGLGYLLCVVITGGLGYPLIGEAEFGLLASHVGLAARVFLDSLWLLSVLASLRHYRSEATGLWVAAAGAACSFGMRSLQPWGVSEAAATGLQDVASQLGERFYGSGTALSTVGMRRFAVGVDVHG